VTGGKPIAVLLQSISGAINLLVAFYDIHGGKREVLFFYFVPDTTRDKYCFAYQILKPMRVLDYKASLKLHMRANPKVHRWIRERGSLVLATP
jgi:hypothetical protein